MSVINRIMNQFTVYALTPQNDYEVFAYKFQTILTWVTGVATGLAVVCASICIIRIMIAEDLNTVAEAKSDLKQLGIAWISILLIDAIIATVFTLVGNAEY